MTNKSWNCAHCGAHNPGTTLTCANCHRIQGSVVVPGQVVPAATGWSRPAPRGNRRPGLLIAVSLFVGVAIAAGTTLLPADTNPLTTTTIAQHEDVYLTDLRVGDCFDLVDPSADLVGAVDLVRCTQPHQYELFWTGTMNGEEYPGDTRFNAFYDVNCVEAFADYVGAVPAQSTLDIFWVVPNEEAWAGGDRSVECAAYDPDDARLTQSLRGHEVTDIGPRT